MSQSLFQKIYLTTLALLFAGTVGYGGWMMGELSKAPVQEGVVPECTGEQEVSLPPDWPSFRMTIPCDWVGEKTGGEFLRTYYGLGKKGVSYRYENEYEYSGWTATPYAISISWTIGYLEGSNDSTVASIRNRYEEDASSKNTIRISGTDATLYDYGEGSVKVLIIDDRDPQTGAYGTSVDVWSIETSLYDDPEVKSVFKRMVETLEFLEEREGISNDIYFNKILGIEVELLGSSEWVLGRKEVNENTGTGIVIFHVVGLVDGQQVPLLGDSNPYVEVEDRNGMSIAEKKQAILSQEYGGIDTDSDENIVTDVSIQGYEGFRYRTAQWNEVTVLFVGERIYKFDSHGEDRIKII